MPLLLDSSLPCQTGKKVWIETDIDEYPSQRFHRFVDEPRSAFPLPSYRFQPIELPLLSKLRSLQWRDKANELHPHIALNRVRKTCISVHQKVTHLLELNKSTHQFLKHIRMERQRTKFYQFSNARHPPRHTERHWLFRYFLILFNFRTLIY